MTAVDEPAVLTQLQPQGAVDWNALLNQVPDPGSRIANVYAELQRMAMQGSGSSANEIQGIMNRLILGILIQEREKVRVLEHAVGSSKSGGLHEGKRITDSKGAAQMGSLSGETG